MIAYRTDEQNPSDDRLRELLVGRSIAKADKVDDQTASLTLDDGTTLTLMGNEGCGGCSEGWYELSHLAAADGIITNVRTDEADNPDGYGDSFRVFVVTASDETMVAAFDGSDNGYYGVGWWLRVEAVA